MEQRRKVTMLVAALMVMLWGIAASAFANDDIYCGGFSDVLRDDPYCADIQWLYDHRITRGCASDRYCPDDYVTREQMAAFLHRFASKLRCRMAPVCETDGAGNTRCRDVAFRCEIYLDP